MGRRWKRFTRGNGDIKFCKQGEQLAKGSGTLWVGGSTSNEKIIQYVQDPWDIELVADYPFQGIRERIEEKRGTSETEGENGVEKIEPFPLHSQEFPV